MPCHNAGRWIGEALGSIANQTLPPHEIIVIDDGSTDNSRAEIEKSGVPVRLLESEARNAAATRNIGIRAATGNWIAFLDADDLWYPHHLERAALLLENSHDVAYIANHHWLRDDGSVQEIPPDLQPALKESKSGLSHLFFPELAVQGFHFGHSTVLLKRDRVLEVGAFDETQKRRHDMDLWLRVLQGRTWAYDAEPVAAYRIDAPDSISKSVVNCEYYFLRALLKNAAGYQNEAMNQLISTAAQRAMSLSFVDGSPEDFRLARSIAWPHLRPNYRVFYRGAGLSRPLMQSAIRLKRRWVWRHVNR